MNKEKFKFIKISNLCLFFFVMSILSFVSLIPLEYFRQDFCSRDSNATKAIDCLLPTTFQVDIFVSGIIELIIFFILLCYVLTGSRVDTD